MSVPVTQLADGNFVVKDAARIVFETNALRKSFNLVPSAAISLSGYAITFPDLLKGPPAYRYNWGASGSVWKEDCLSYGWILPQEWGPDEAAPRTLADITIGTVPEGTDYLDVQIKLTRTFNPSTWMGLQLDKILPDNQWVSLGSEACTLVEQRGDIFGRMIAFYLDGTTVKLLRKQSVKDNNPGIFRDDNNPALNGWTHGGNTHGWLGYEIQQKGPVTQFLSTVQHLKRNSSAGTRCSLVDPSNYQSTWTGDIIITPGRVSA